MINSKNTEADFNTLFKQACQFSGIIDHEQIASLSILFKRKIVLGEGLYNLRESFMKYRFDTDSIVELFQIYRNLPGVISSIEERKEERHRRNADWQRRKDEKWAKNFAFLGF